MHASRQGRERRITTIVNNAPGKSVSETVIESEEMAFLLCFRNDEMTTEKAAIGGVRLHIHLIEAHFHFDLPRNEREWKTSKTIINLNIKWRNSRFVCLIRYRRCHEAVTCTVCTIRGPICPRSRECQHSRLSPASNVKKRQCVFAASKDRLAFGSLPTD